MAKSIGGIPSDETFSANAGTRIAPFKHQGKAAAELVSLFPLNQQDFGFEHVAFRLTPQFVGVLVCSSDKHTDGSRENSYVWLFTMDVPK